MPAKIEFTQEQLKKMAYLRVEERMNYSQIAREMNTSQQTVKRRLEDILSTEVNNVPLQYEYDRYFFYDIDSKEKAYWLGFITADGYINEDRNFLSLHLQWRDHEHLNKFLKAIQAEKRIKVKKEIHSTTGNFIASLTLNGKEMVECLNRHGVRQRKSGHEIPDENIPKAFVQDYIRGLWDGDGHIRKRSIDLRSSFKMCSWVQDWLHDECNISKCKISFDSNIYRLYVCKGRIDTLKYLYYPCVNKDICLDRKYKQAKILMLENLKQSRLKTSSQKS